MLMPQVTLQRELRIDGPSSCSVSPRDIAPYPQEERTSGGGWNKSWGSHTHPLFNRHADQSESESECSNRLSSQAEAEISQGSKTENGAGSRSRLPHPSAQCFTSSSSLQLTVLWPNHLNIYDFTFQPWKLVRVKILSFVQASSPDFKRQAPLI